MPEKKTKKSVAKKKDGMIFVRFPLPLIQALDTYREAAGMETQGETIRQIVRDELVRRGLFKMPGD